MNFQTEIIASRQHITSCEFLGRKGRTSSFLGRHDPLQRGRLLRAARLHGGVGRRLGSQGIVLLVGRARRRLEDDGVLGVVGVLPSEGAVPEGEDVLVAQNLTGENHGWAMCDN